MKKKTARKSLIIMLAIVITIAMMPTMAFAGIANGGGQTCGDNLTWELSENNETLTIKGEGTTMTDYTNTALPPWNTHKGQIKSIDIQASALTNIGNYAFDGCANLTTVTLPESVTAIGLGVFGNNALLPSINLSNIKNINTSAFYGCKSLATAEM
ncbi:MAG: leucine-rich repeat domain-containing protein, partial [Anaerovoracaceae bacterium]